jgi:hypothetical protein
MTEHRTDEQAELAVFTAEFETLAQDPQPVLLELRKTEAWILAAQLQLALRNTGPTAIIARRIVAQLHDAVATTPPLKALAAKGWQPEHDAPTDEQWASNTLAEVLDHLHTHAHQGCTSCTAWVRGHGGTVGRG